MSSVDPRWAPPQESQPFTTGQPPQPTMPPHPLGPQQTPILRLPPAPQPAVQRPHRVAYVLAVIMPVILLAVMAAPFGIAWTIARVRQVPGSATTPAPLDPNAPGGTLTNFPNPCHPPLQGTTLAYKLDDDATVKIRIFSQTGQLVKEANFSRSQTGGTVGLNTWQWDGRNGSGEVVASGGYIVLVEAQGAGQTLHVMRRKIAVVR